MNITRHSMHLVEIPRPIRPLFVSRQIQQPVPIQLIMGVHQRSSTVTIDRTLWLSSFTESEVPRWPCPHCETGTLRLKEEKRKPDQTWSVFPVVRRSDAASERDQKKVPHWTPMDDSGLFGALLECDRRECNDVVSLCGTYGVDISYDDEGAYEWVVYHRPLYIHPAPPMFQVPANCPPPIKEEIKAAFKLFWCDTSSCLNRIRTATEMLLTEKKIKRFGRAKTKGDPRPRLSLASRIEIMANKQPELKLSMSAIRWLGNAGSHGGELKQDTALDAFELLEYVLDSLYVQRGRALNRMSKEIIKRKGPRRK